MPTYLEDTSAALVRVLDRANQLPPIRLAGYLATLDFWASEVRHVLGNIASYKDRFAKMDKSMREYAQRTAQGTNPILLRNQYEDYGGPKKESMLRSVRALSDQRLWELKDELELAFIRLLRRLEKHELVTLEQANAILEETGITLRDKE